MANQDFVEIISDKAISNIAVANAELSKLLNTMNVTVTTANKLNIAGAGKAPSQSNANTAANNAAIERNIRAIERQRLSEIRLQQQRERAFDQYERQLARENANLERANSVYTKIQNKISQLTVTYNNLAAKKELGLRLTDRETAQLSTLEGRLQRYQQVLGRVDQNIGNYRRNVGNYASGFNPLNNAIGQLAREAPNAAQSFQIFAMSISNNIGALQDSITQLRAQNAQLVAQGQPVRSVFSQVLGSVLSLNTALYVGIAIFIAYSKEISTFFNSLFAGAKALDAVAESSKQLNDIRVSSLKSITQERIELQNNLGIARDTTLSYRDREIAAQKVLDQYPYWFESLGKEAILNGNVQKAIEGVNAALLARALANAAVGKITENQGKIIDLEEKRFAIQQKILALEKDIETSRKVQSRTTGGGTVAGTYDLSTSAAARLLMAQQKLASIGVEINAINEVNNRLLQYSIQQSKEAIGLDYETEQQSKKAAEERVQAETNSRVAFERTISSLEEKLSLMSQENSSYGFLQGQLNLVKGAYEALYGAQKDNNEETEKTIKYGTVEYYTDVINKLSKERDQLADNTEQYALYSRMIERSQEELDKLTGKAEDVKKLNDEVQKYLKGFSEGFLTDAKLGSFNMFLSLDEEGKSPFDKLLEQADTAREKFAVTFNAIAETAQEAFAFIQQNQQAQFDAMYANLDREKELRLQYVGDNEMARAEIERQYEERRREVRRKELQAQKEQALFNIALNTAQGITAALASVPPNVPLSIVIGAIGAAQLALVASRQIPAYKMGTDNHGGGLAIVGDGGKHEVVHQPTLGWSVTPNKDTLVNLEKGSKVFPDLASSGIFNSNLPDMVQLNGGGLTVSQMDYIMSKYHAKQVPHIHIDKSGIKAYTKGVLSSTENMNNIVRFQGRKK